MTVYDRSAINTGSASLCSTNPVFSYGKKMMSENVCTDTSTGRIKLPSILEMFRVNAVQIRISSRQTRSVLSPNNSLSKLIHRCLKPSYRKYNTTHRCCNIATFILQYNLRILLERGHFKKVFPKNIICQSQWPRGLRRRSAAARLLRLWVRSPPGAWMSVCCECCVLSGRGLCDGLVTRRSLTDCGLCKISSDHNQSIVIEL